MSRGPVTVAELTRFTAWADRNLAELERQDLALFLAFRPLSGEVIPGLHGLRKLRWKRPGQGKRGGYRVIYYFHDERLPLFLMAAYAKSSQADLTPDEKRALVKLVEGIRVTAKAKRL